MEFLLFVRAPGDRLNPDHRFLLSRVFWHRLRELLPEQFCTLDSTNRIPSVTPGHSRSPAGDSGLVSGGVLTDKISMQLPKSLRYGNGRSVALSRRLFTE